MFSFQSRAPWRNGALLGILVLSILFSPAGSALPTATALAQEQPADLAQPASARLQINAADYAGPAYWDEFPQVFSITTGPNGVQSIIPGPDSRVRLLVQLRGDPLAVYQMQLQSTLGKSSPGYAAQLSAYRAQLQASRQQVLAGLEAQGISYRLNREYDYLFNGLALSTSQGEWQHIASLSQVKAVFPDYQVHATLNDSVPLIGAPQVWAMTDPHGQPVTGGGMRVAIVDTGIDYTHPDLGGCFGPSCKVVGGYDFVNGDADPMDDFGHGTHVAGIVAANGILHGVAPEASLLAYKVLDQGGSGMDSDIIAAIEKAADPDGNPATEDGADILNMSLGGPGNPDDPFSQAVDHAVDLGMVVVVAAGNNGIYYSLGAPASARQAITVAASDKQDSLAYFSSRGPVPGYFDLVKPEVTAPGVAITSTVPISAPMGSPTGYAPLDGTSMASPHVAGAAALLRQLHPDWTPAQIKASLMNTAVELDADLPSQGAGRIAVNHAATVTSLVSPGAVSYGLDDIDQPVWMGTHTITVTNISTTSLDYTLTATLPLTQGINLAVSPAAFSLAPGASRLVSATLTVDNSLVPYPTSPSMGYEAAIHLQAGGQPVRVPYTFYKASRLHVTFEDGLPWGIILHDRQNTIQSVSLSYPYTQTVAYLPPGTYDVIATYSFTTTVFQEGIPVSGTTDLTLSPAQAQNEVELRPLNENGSELLGGGGKSMMSHGWVFDGRFSSGIIGEPCYEKTTCLNVLHLSDVGAGYDYETRFMFLQDSGKAPTPSYYDILFELGEISDDVVFQNNPAQLRTTRMDYRPDQALPSLTLRRWWTQALPGMMIGFSFGDWVIPVNGSYSEQVYFSPSTENATDCYTSFDLYSGEFPDEQVLYATQLVYAPATADAIRLYVGFEPLPGEVGKNLLVGPGPLHWSGKLVAGQDQHTLFYNASLPPLSDQSLSGVVGTPLSYTISQEGTVIDQGIWQDYHHWTLPEPGAYTMTISHRGYHLDGVEGYGQATLGFDTTRDDSSAPQLLSLTLLENGWMSDTVSKFGNIQFSLADESALQQVELWLKLDEGTWQAVPLTQNGGRYTAQLSDLVYPLSEATLANDYHISLRIRAQDAAGNWLAYETSPGFLLRGVSQPQIYIPLMRH